MAEKQLDEKQLQALLRLKRFEQPPPGYFDDLLANIHRRQREEMLEQSSWRIGFDRLKALFSTFRMDWSYAASMVAILMLGVGAIQLAIPQKNSLPQIASLAVAQAPVIATEKLVSSTPANTRMISLQQSAEPMLGTDFPSNNILRESAPAYRKNAPRYVIDARPVSYEQTQIRF